ncbi:hypothetical protein FQN60_015883 [Etheostoma spectabile]|uniref:Uncharacterized protein n=1 Tax=Etheostoma spectabile TaxID=54343 RepID=A0A5J5CNS4_9PERO|nr:hypothetical protein FQN60_015883 [Etheostoma spectabile]
MSPDLINYSLLNRQTLALALVEVLGGSLSDTEETRSILKGPEGRSINGGVWKFNGWREVQTDDTLSSFQHPRSSIFLSLERVTLSSACVHTPVPSTHTHTTTQPRTSMARSFDGPPWNKNTRCLSKASFIRGGQKDGFTSALFPPLGPGLGPFSPVPSLSPSCSHPTGAFQHGAVGGVRTGAKNGRGSKRRKQDEQFEMATIKTSVIIHGQRGRCSRLGHVQTNPPSCSSLLNNALSDDMTATTAPSFWTAFWFAQGRDVVSAAFRGRVRVQCVRVTGKQC